MVAEQTPTLEATLRSNSGKGVARKLRADGLIPGVCYGTVDNTPLSINPDEFDKLWDSPHRFNTVFQLKFDDKAIDNVMLRDYQIDPVSRELLHVDLIAVDAEEPVAVVVPLETTGRAKGVRMGGKLRLIRHEMQVKCKPSDIPESIVVDVTELGPEDAILANQVTLPEGVEPNYKANFAIARIQMPRVSAKKTEEVKKKK